MADAKEILAALRKREDEVLTTSPDPENVVAALEAVLALHTAHTDIITSGYRGGRGDLELVTCETCEYEWPCPTVQAVTSALGAEPESGSERGRVGDPEP
jgi:hypothetical protein